MTVKQIVAEWLVKNGFDGLCSENCGCPLDDLMCCGLACDSCKPGYKQLCKGCPEFKEDCDACFPGGYCVTEKKGGGG